MAKRVLFVVPYPERRAPSQRFRVELYLPFLQEHGVDYRMAPFLDASTFAILYGNASSLQKAWGVVKGYLKRIGLVLFVVPAYDYVFVHREGAPLGPPLFEWWMAKVWRKKIIYDFDDAIWISDTRSRWLNLVKWYGKVRSICTWSYKVAAGNAYLAEFAARSAKNVVLLPTCVDVVNRHNRLKAHGGHRPIVGWTGSHSTLRYLEPLAPVLHELTAELDFEVVVICNKPPEFALPNFRFLPWSETTEIDDLLQLDVGLMPLEHDAWSEGKCGFKLIQYLALGIPALASPVGVNKQIVEEGVEGYLCTASAQWRDRLRTLLLDADLRARMGKAGREKIVRDFSIQANEGAFRALFS